MYNEACQICSAHQPSDVAEVLRDLLDDSSSMVHVIKHDDAYGTMVTNLTAVEALLRRFLFFYFYFCNVHDCLLNANVFMRLFASLGSRSARASNAWLSSAGESNGSHQPTHGESRPSASCNSFMFGSDGHVRQQSG